MVVTHTEEKCTVESARAGVTSQTREGGGEVCIEELDKLIVSVQPVRLGQRPR